MYRQIQAADFDGDGLNDLIMRRDYTVSGFSLFLRRLGGGYDPSKTLSAGSVSFVDFDDFPVSDYTDIWCITNGNLLGDPRPELVFATESKIGVASVAEQNPGSGDWKWTNEQLLINGPRYDVNMAGAVITGDFNDDGLSDLAYVSVNKVYLRFQR
jgi:hypothetical protein